jgi:hypothetical protein
MHVTPIDAQGRMGVIRATASFDHAILFGLFCAVAGALLLYSEENRAKRIAWVGLCLFGSYLSLSSSALMAYAILFGAYAYDGMLVRFPGRWKVLWGVCALFALAIMLATRDPLGWVLSHLTLDPESGYFRILEWNAAIDEISLSPWVGFAFFNFGTAELYSVDCVWLCMTLRYGLTMIALLFVLNVMALFPGRRSVTPEDPFLGQMRLALASIVFIFMFVGLTAHFWNFMWIFWGTCLGISVALREQSLNVGPQPDTPPAQASDRRWERRAPVGRRYSNARA